jgi:hypothetical protein
MDVQYCRGWWLVVSERVASYSVPVMPSEYFPSKRDTWLVVLIWAGAVGVVVAGIDLLDAPLPPAGRAALELICFGTAGFILWVIHGTGYFFADAELIIRCGPFRVVVPLAAIREVHPSRSPLSSPALSLDRLHIKYDGSRGGVLISPMDKAEFLQALVARNPRLRIDGDRVVRV